MQDMQSSQRKDPLIPGVDCWWLDNQPAGACVPVATGTVLPEGGDARALPIMLHFAGTASIVHLVPQSLWTAGCTPGCAAHGAHAQSKRRARTTWRLTRTSVLCGLDVLCSVLFRLDIGVESALCPLHCVFKDASFSCNVDRSIGCLDFCSRLDGCHWWGHCIGFLGFWEDSEWFFTGSFLFFRKVLVILIMRPLSKG